MMEEVNQSVADRWISSLYFGLFVSIFTCQSISDKFGFWKPSLLESRSILDFARLLYVARCTPFLSRHRFAPVRLVLPSTMVVS